LYLEKYGSEIVIRSARSLDFAIGDSDYPRGYVELSALPDYGSEVLYEVQQALLFGGGGAVIIAGLVGLWISHWLASPMKRLAETAVEMGEGDLTVRADVKSSGEIGELASQFNHMANQLETSFEAIREERDTLQRFITDASHELRTPITALKNFNTLLHDDPVDTDTRMEFITESGNQIERLEWITNNLLDLSRMDSGLDDLNVNDQDLRDVIEVSVASFKQAAKVKGIKIKMNLPGNPCVFSCDRSRIEMAVSNVLDNAIKFTPQSGRIEIGIDDREGYQIWVKDTGVGIKPEDLPYIFNRFYRGSGQVERGSGLGLAIVKSIFQAHNGTVSAESSPGEGTMIRMIFPSE